MNLPRVYAIAVSLIAGLTLGCTSVGFAQDAPTEDPFIPFSKPGDLDGEQPTGPKAPGRTSARISDDVEPAEQGSGFKWPSLPKPKMPSLPKLSFPSWATEKREMPRERMHQHQPEEPSTWSKLTGGTKDMFSKTKQTLMPWTNDAEEAPVRRPVPPRRSPNKTKAVPASAEKKSFFSWLSPKEEKQPGTVNDFLAQPRLK